MTDRYEQCIADYLEVDADGLLREDYEHWGLEVYEGYAVGTDEEADKAAKEYIKESLWAFKADFLAEMTDLPRSVFEALQTQCENSNDAVLAIIDNTCGLEDFAQAAIDADGRGHFLATYDGEQKRSYYIDEQGDRQILNLYRID